MPVKQCMLLVVLVVMVLSVQGCETCKGAKKDAQNVGMNLQTLDDWIAKYLW